MGKGKSRKRTKSNINHSLVDKQYDYHYTSKQFKKETTRYRDSKPPYWTHPGGKLRELGSEKLSDVELLSILISTGTKGKSAEKIAEEILAKFGSFKGMANQPLERFLQFKGIGDVKIIRIAAAFEIARRIVQLVLANHEK